MKVKLTKQVVVNGASGKVGEVYEVSKADAMILIGYNAAAILSEIDAEPKEVEFPVVEEVVSETKKKKK